MVVLKLVRFIFQAPLLVLCSRQGPEESEDTVGEIKLDQAPLQNTSTEQDQDYQQGNYISGLATTSVVGLR